MAAPTSYTEETLATFMHTKLGKIASALGYAAASSYSEEVSDTLLAYGTDDISTISGPANIIKLRTLAEMYAWRKAVGDLSTKYKFSADGGTYDRQQMFENAQKALATLELTVTITYDTAYAVQTTKGRSKHDPYAYIPEDEAGL
ncbi:MAG TPA: hypothetical protein DCS05_03835 [Nitrospiraceae bacterium]|nr:hypothetical protein [Nitrospiraceae bacterium]